MFYLKFLQFNRLVMSATFAMRMPKKLLPFNLLIFKSVDLAG